MVVTRKTLPPKTPCDTQVLRSYESCVAAGYYGRKGEGLQGKYDNVRRHWEDPITRYALHDFVLPLANRKREARSKIRALDLGAGSGEGYEILTTLRKPGENLASKEIEILPPHLLGFYKGLDISPGMVEQGKALYEHVPKVTFEVGDLSQGLGRTMEDDPYDIYFSSYGSLSHLRDSELAQLINDIYDHAEGSFIFVADLVGRYSYEWPCYWGPEGPDASALRPYSMSYLYPKEPLHEVEVERFPMRYWHAGEFDRFMEGLIVERGGRILHRKRVDRSILVGRHMNTGEFNPKAQPLRTHVNSLPEFDRRTELDALFFRYAPSGDFRSLNAFFERFQDAWNAVIGAAIEAVERWNDGDFLRQEPAADLPRVVQEAIRTIRRVVLHLEGFRMGDTRANVFEPQLGYLLRTIEMDLQESLGAGHGLLATYEVRKAE